MVTIVIENENNQATEAPESDEGITKHTHVLHARFYLI